MIRSFFRARTAPSRMAYLVKRRWGGHFVTMDFGCIYDGYCSDMTRTVAVGDVTDEMQTVYDPVLNAQLAGIAACKARCVRSGH